MRPLFRDKKFASRGSGLPMFASGISVFATVVHRIAFFVSVAQWVLMFASMVHKDSVSASSVQRIQLFVDFSVYLFSIQRV